MRWTSASFAVGVVILAAAALTGCSSAPPDMTVNGTVEIAVQSFTETQDYPQIINDTAQVTVTDPTGKVISVTTADNGNVPQGPAVLGDETLTVGFTVKVPEGESFYGISVSGISGTVHFTEAQMKAGPALCVGDECSG
jgi:hypothetical protein